MDTDLDAIDDDDLLNRMLEDHDNMEDSANPVPPSPPLLPIPYRKTTATPTTMTSPDDAAATTEKPYAVTPRMETFEKRLLAI